MSIAHSKPLYDLTIHQASALIQSKQLSPVELVQSYLGRINEVEKQVQAWVTVAEEKAIQAARTAEQDILAGNSAGPLHGIPFGAKDLYYTAGIRTSAGSKVAEDFVPATSATVITRLQKAGAILLGKTTTTEYAFFGGPPPTRNPWNLQHSPGGSSSGSAAALAASMAAFTLGSQTAGSLSRPASYNGLTALKATYGRVSRAGIIAASWSLDHAGAFTRCIEDNVLVLQAIAGADDLDPTTIQGPVPNFSDALQRDINGMVIGIPDRYFFEGIDSELAAAVEAATSVFRMLGVEIVPVQLPESFEEANIAHRVVMLAEAASYHQDLYSHSAHLYTPALRELLELGLLTPAVDYLRAQRIRNLYRGELISLLGQVDAILTPTAPTPAPEGQHFTGSPMFNVPFTNAGVPTLQIPIGLTQKTGLPLGLQLAARPLREDLLIRLGHAYQRVENWHELRPEINLGDR
jgi:aspartyl-tRNA(Asn)/glutamyl-tRNA(Gln) amidotransferase subunit A